jgi:hypothetical protein
MTVQEVISQTYSNSCGEEQKQITKWLEEYLQLKYEIEYIKKHILSIESSAERQTRSEFFVKRLVDLYGGNNYGI